MREACYSRRPKASAATGHLSQDCSAMAEAGGGVAGEAGLCFARHFTYKRHPPCQRWGDLKSRISASGGRSGGKPEA